MPASNAPRNLWTHHVEEREETLFNADLLAITSRLEKLVDSESLNLRRSILTLERVDILFIFVLNFTLEDFLSPILSVFSFCCDLKNINFFYSNDFIFPYIQTVSCNQRIMYSCPSALSGDVREKRKRRERDWKQLYAFVKNL